MHSHLEITELCYTIVFQFLKMDRRKYRSTGGCVICGVKSALSMFTASTRYEEHFFNVFELDEERTGEICNSCVLLVKRWHDLDPESKATKSWRHVSVHVKKQTETLR